MITKSEQKNNGLKALFQAAFTSIINYRTKPDSTTNFESIQSINLICVFLISGSALYIGQWIMLGYYPLALLTALFCISYGLSFIWIKIGKAYYASYHCLITAFTHFMIYSTVMFDRNAGFQWFLIAIIPASFLMLPNASRWHHFMFAVAVMLGMTVSEIGLHYEPLFDFPTDYRTVSIFIEGILLVITLNLAMEMSNKAIDKYRAKLTTLSQKDELTQIHNRRFFMSSIKHYAINTKQTHFILTLDLDHFKKINDQYGHATGDDALIHVANTINQIIPKGTLFARLGGEEFALLCQTDFKEHAIAIAEEIKEAIATHHITSTEGEHFYCTASIGVAQLTQNDSLSMQLSDKALYQAKAQGRNCVVFAEHDIKEVETNEP